MYRTDNSTNTASIPTPGAIGPNPDGFYQDTDGGGGTIVDADHLNAMQEEIAYVITNNGDALSKTDRTQLDKAVRDIAVEGLAPAAYTGGESVTLPNGLIMKMGIDVDANASGSVVFGAAFPTGLVSITVTPDNAANTTVSYNTESAAGFTWEKGAGAGVSWMAIGY